MAGQWTLIPSMKVRFLPPGLSGNVDRDPVMLTNAGEELWTTARAYSHHIMCCPLARHSSFLGDLPVPSQVAGIHPTARGLARYTGYDQLLN
jgi:hypothetical protein